MKKIVFKDQPNGKCDICTWNKSYKKDEFICSCSFKHLTNMVCIGKRQLCEQSNTSSALYDNSDGEEWKNGE